MIIAARAKRGMLYLLAIITMALSLVDSSVVSTAFGDEEILVERDVDAGTTTVIVPSQYGRISWHNVFRGLARASRLDDAEIPNEFAGKYLNLTERRSRLAIRTLSAAIPDVQVRVIDHPSNFQPALQIRLDRDDARNSIRQMKAFVRDELGNDADAYGLRLDNGWSQQPLDDQLVVLVHGYTSGPNSLDELHSKLTAVGWPCATFAYPNDGPLHDSGELLATELARFREQYPERRLAIVAHSMGGLVARVAIEDPALDPKNVTRLIMICTPNHGSQWAKLPGGLDCCEHVIEGNDSDFCEEFRASISDGLNEARADLKPQSKFLRELNARHRNPSVRYTLVLGTEAPFTAEEISRLRQCVATSLEDSRSGRLVLPRVDEFFSGLEELECGKGDTVVSVERGKLAGVEDTILLPITHWTISADDKPPRREPTTNVSDVVRLRFPLDQIRTLASPATRQEELHAFILERLASDERRANAKVNRN